MNTPYKPIIFLSLALSCTALFLSYISHTNSDSLLKSISQERLNMSKHGVYHSLSIVDSNDNARIVLGSSNNDAYLLINSLNLSNAITLSTGDSNANLSINFNSTNVFKLDSDDKCTSFTMAHENNPKIINMDVSKYSSSIIINDSSNKTSAGIESHDIWSYGLVISNEYQMSSVDLYGLQIKNKYDNHFALYGQNSIRIQCVRTNGEAYLALYEPAGNILFNKSSNKRPGYYVSNRHIFGYESGYAEFSLDKYDYLVLSNSISTIRLGSFFSDDTMNTNIDRIVHGLLLSNVSISNGHKYAEIELSVARDSQELYFSSPTSRIYLGQRNYVRSNPFHRQKINFSQDIDKQPLFDVTTFYDDLSSSATMTLSAVPGAFMSNPDYGDISTFELFIKDNIVDDELRILYPQMRLFRRGGKLLNFQFPFE